MEGSSNCQRPTRSFEWLLARKERWRALAWETSLSKRGAAAPAPDSFHDISLAAALRRGLTGSLDCTLCSIGEKGVEPTLGRGWVHRSLV